MKIARLSALRPAAFTPKEIFLELISVTSWVDRRDVVRPEGLFINLVVCLTTGPKPLAKRALSILRSRAYSFICEYPLLSLRLSRSFLHLIPRLRVTSIPPFILPSITCRRRQFLRNMWPIHLAFRFLIWKDYVNEKFQRQHRESNPHHRNV
jgi:hypothetical protein